MDLSSVPCKLVGIVGAGTAVTVRNNQTQVWAQASQARVLWCRVVPRFVVHWNIKTMKIKYNIVLVFLTY